jgi:transposase
VPIGLSTLADQVGGCTAALMPLFKRLAANVLSAERLHGTRVPVLAKGKTDTGRIWVYVRDDKPFGGPAPPGGCVLLLARPGRQTSAGAAGQLHRIFQADAYEGYGKLYEGGHASGPIWKPLLGPARRPFLRDGGSGPENARRKAQGKKPAVISPLALEAVRWIDELFESCRATNGQSPERHEAVRQELRAQLVANLVAWIREQRAKLSRGNDVAKAMDYMLKRRRRTRDLPSQGRPPNGPQASQGARGGRTNAVLAAAGYNCSPLLPAISVP